MPDLPRTTRRTETWRVAAMVSGTACTLVLGSCSSSRAEGSGGVHLRRFEPEARIESEVRNEKYTGGAGARTDQRIFRENIQFDFEGDAYHPKLATFRGLLDLGLEQREVDQAGAPETVRANNDNNRYDLHAELLKDHPYSVHVFALRNQARVRQTFFPTSDAVVTKEGATLMAKEWVVPSQIEVSHYDFQGRYNDTREEQRDVVNATGASNSDAFSTYYQVFTQSVDSNVAGGRYDDFQALGGMNWRFGPDYADSVGIDAQHRTQTGDTENENSSLTARSRLLFDEDLENRSGVSIGRSSFGVDAERTDRTDAYSEMEHRLYDSLTTTVRGDWLEQHIGEGDLNRLGGSGRARYRKKVGFGEMNATYLLSRSRQEEQGRFGANVTVSDEPHVYVLGNPIVLVNQNVDAIQILVTDATGAIVYSTPTDYLVDTVGTVTRLVIPATSLILPGQTILVTYTYAIAGDQTFDSDMQYAALQFVFGETLTLEGHWSELDQDLVAGVSNATLDHAREVGVAARIRYGMQNFDVEYEDHESLLAPYTRARTTWFTFTPLAQNITLNTNASVYDTLYTDENLHERGQSALVGLTWQRFDSFTWDLRAEARHSELRTEEGFGTFLQSITQYRWRKSSLDLTVLASQENWDVSSDRDILRVTLTFRRKF
ncbi:MAG: hypothetical protein ABL982_19425 [Vicinamibacterales bacterium]